MLPHWKSRQGPGSPEHTGRAEDRQLLARYQRELEKAGERKERTDWHRVVVFNERIADVAERYLRKGRKVYVEGTLQTRKWTDQSGQERYSTEVVIERFRGELVLLDSGKDDAAGSSEAGRKSATIGGSGSGWDAPRGGNPDDEIRF